MGTNIVFFLLFTFLSISTPSPTESKSYRSDYVYNLKSDAFYKLHIEEMRRSDAKDICTFEGAKLMVPTERDIVQLHGMLKQYPDIGNKVWIDSDGANYESAEETPIIDLSQLIEEENEVHLLSSQKCNVALRNGKVETSTCYGRLPFICKVQAKDAFYDNHCHVYARNYKYVPNVGSCYKMPQIAYSWNQAYAECQAENAHLVVINSETEMLAIKNLTNTEPPVPHAKTSWFFLVGFRADKPVGNSTKVFKTIFNQTLEDAGYAEWAPNEPNNSSNEDCGTVFKNDGKFNDVDCSHPYGFICEKEIQINN